MSLRLTPPVLVFTDRQGGFFVFHQPSFTGSGADLAAAEALARDDGVWLAGGWRYARAEDQPEGWWGVFPERLEVSAADLRTEAEPGPVVLGPREASWGPEAYAQAFAAVREALRDGVTYQANLTFALQGRAAAGGAFTWRTALKLWLDLVADQGREAVFAALGSDAAPLPLLTSLSPELFFEREGDLVRARPMKGTALRGADPAADEAARQALQTGDKTRAENLMVTDMLRNDLGRLALPGSVAVPALFATEAYPTLWQMTSTVEARLPGGFGLQPLLRALFPCASITGAPKLSTQDLLARVEDGERGWYTGTLGWHRAVGEQVASRFSVLIRTLDWQADGRYRLGVGGGVVWDSLPGQEYQEAWDKARFLGRLDRDFSLTEALLWVPAAGFFLLEAHLDRLEAACGDFGGRLDRAAACQALERAVELSGQAGTELKVRLLVLPDFGLRAEAEAVNRLPEILGLAWAPAPLTPDSLLFRRYKTTRRHIYDLPRAPGVDQLLFVNEDGEVTESTSMNLVVERDGVRLTPRLEAGLLGGVFRRHLLEGGQIREARLLPDDVVRADRLWLINSVRRWNKARLCG